MLCAHLPACLLALLSEFLAMQRSAIDRTRTWNDMTSMYRTDPSGKTEVTGLGVGVKLAHDALPKYAMVRYVLPPCSCAPCRTFRSCVCARDHAARHAAHRAVQGPASRDVGDGPKSRAVQTEAVSGVEPFRAEGLTRAEPAASAALCAHGRMERLPARL